MPIIAKRLKQFRTKSFKRTLRAIPFFFTFANALLGFLSIIKSAEGDFITAAYCIMLAVLMDALDGRLARAFGCSSSLGMELDSLCDAISFCLAPAILVYNWYFAVLAWVGPIVVAAYVCAGLFRLARFNCTGHEQVHYFQGIATPVAALLLVSLVLYEPWFDASVFASLLHPTPMVIFLATVAYLMISPLRFASFKKIYRTRIQRCLMVFIASAVIAHALLYGYPLLFLVLVLYVVIGIVTTIVQVVREVVVE